MVDLTLENFLNREGLNVQRKNGLILFDYDRIITYSGDWDNTTVWARGLVFEESTGKLVTFPIKKFWNWQESQFQEIYESKIKGNDEPYIATTKVDGSCGFVSYHNGDWIVHTRGSFESDQAKWAKIWLDKNLDKSKMNPNYTYIVEIIYPNNRIVINYNGKEALVLITVNDKESMRELTREKSELIAKELNIEIVDTHEFNSIEEILEKCKTLSSDEEGYCLYYPNLQIRCKIKGEAYCKIHKMLANLTPLAFWESINLDNLEIPVEYLAILPEEFRNISDLLKEAIEKLHKDELDKVSRMGQSVEYLIKENEMTQKETWFFLQDKFPNDYSFVSDYLKGNHKKLKDKIHRMVRPTGNVIPGVDLSRIERVIDDG